MEASLWNIGVKIDDLAREVDFFEALGGKVLVRETRSKSDGEAYEVALLEFGKTRLSLMPKPLFEDALSHPLIAGLTHAVFEVDNLEEAYEQITGLGAETLCEPRQICVGLGTRRIAFFRSPNGFVFEVMQILESKV